MRARRSLPQLNRTPNAPAARAYNARRQGGTAAQDFAERGALQGAYAPPRNQVAELPGMALEMTGLPSIRRSAAAFASGDPGTGTLEGVQGGIGVLSLAAGMRGARGAPRVAEPAAAAVATTNPSPSGYPLRGGSDRTGALYAFDGPRNTEYRIYIDNPRLHPSGLHKVEFAEVGPGSYRRNVSEGGNPYGQIGGNNTGDALRVYRSVVEAIRRDAASGNPRPGYVWSGATPEQQRLYEAAFRKLDPPPGFARERSGNDFIWRRMRGARGAAPRAPQPPRSITARAPDAGNAGGGRVVYRGLNRPYDPANGGYYQSFTSSLDDAREYGPNVIAARINPGRNLAVDGGGNNFNALSVEQLPTDVRARLHPSIGQSATTDQIAHAAREAGYDSVTVRNVHDNRWGERPVRGSEPRTIDFVFDTRNVSPLDQIPAQQTPAVAFAEKVKLSAADRALLDELFADDPPARSNTARPADPEALSLARSWIDSFGGGPDAEARAISVMQGQLRDAGHPVWRQRLQDAIDSVATRAYVRGEPTSFSPRVQEAWPDIYGPAAEPPPKPTASKTTRAPAKSGLFPLGDRYRG